MERYRARRSLLRRLRDGRPVRLRPLQPADMGQVEELFAQLSAESRYLRFMAPMPRVTAEFLARLEDDLRVERAAVLVAVIEQESQPRLIGSGRIVPTDRPSVCEFSLTILDAWHGLGLGRTLLHELERRARRLNYHRIEGAVLTINYKMLAVALRRGFHLHCEAGDPGCMRVYKHLYDAATARLASATYASGYDEAWTRRE